MSQTFLELKGNDEGCQQKGFTPYLVTIVLFYEGLESYTAQSHALRLHALQRDSAGLSPTLLQQDVDCCKSIAAPQLQGI